MDIPRDVLRMSAMYAEPADSSPNQSFKQYGTLTGDPRFRHKSQNSASLIPQERAIDPELVFQTVAKFVNTSIGAMGLLDMHNACPPKNAFQKR